GEELVLAAVRFPERLEERVAPPLLLEERLLAVLLVRHVPDDADEPPRGAPGRELVARAVLDPAPRAVALPADPHERLEAPPGRRRLGEPTLEGGAVVGVDDVRQELRVRERTLVARAPEDLVEPVVLPEGAVLGHDPLEDADASRARRKAEALLALLERAL